MVAKIHEDDLDNLSTVNKLFSLLDERINSGTLLFPDC